MTPVPSDPRTWAGFSHIGVRGFTKVECETRLERITTTIGFGLAIFGAVWIWAMYATAHPITQAEAAAAVGDWRPAAVLIAGLGFLALRLMTDNFYLVDPARHAVYLHFKFGPFRRVQLLDPGR
jgi:hypothetical protein